MRSLALSLALAAMAFTGAAHVDSPGLSDALRKAMEQKRPLLVFFRPAECPRCDGFESTAIPHPATQRRLQSLVYAPLPASEAPEELRQRTDGPALALFDGRGALRATWKFVPDTANLIVILDSVNAVAADLERIAELADEGKTTESDLLLAGTLARLGFTPDARELLERVRQAAGANASERATITEALLDLSEGKETRSLEPLVQLASKAQDSSIAAEAWLLVGTIRATSGAPGALDAFESALRAAPAASELRETAARSVETLRARSATPPVKILPLGQQVIARRHTVAVRVSSPVVQRVVLSLDGKVVRNILAPPFVASLDFGDTPQRHTIRAEGFDRKGRSTGVDERVVNEAGETFWTRLLAPRSGFIAGSALVKSDVRVPVNARVERVVISWNDATRAVITTPPWESEVAIPGTPGILRVQAELDDGRTSEDAVFLNGISDRADVQFVQLPLTVLRDGKPASIAAEQISVREGSRLRPVESIAASSETPLTIGLVIDVSESMHRTLPDVQEAAIRFLENSLGPRDRAFIVTFNTRARLLQPPTSDLASLRRHILALRADGLTAINDALLLALLQFEGVKGRRAIVAFTDGMDRTSLHEERAVKDLAHRGSVPLHIIASIAGTPAAQGGTGESTASVRDTFLHQDLHDAARATGGSVHVLDDLAKLPDVYATIEAALRAQVLAFVRTEPAAKDNDWRAVTVGVSGDGLSVFTPAGYYATW